MSYTQTLLFSNNASTTLATNLSSTATTLTVAAGAGALFPSPTSGQAFTLTLIDAATQTKTEVMICTAVSGDTLTVVRGQEGTTAQTWLAGDYAKNLLTAGTAQAFAQSILLPTIYALIGGSSAHAFLVANSTASTQQAVPRAQADTLYQPVGSYQPAGSYAALNGSASQVFNVANAVTSTEAVALGQSTASSTIHASTGHNVGNVYTNLTGKMLIVQVTASNGTGVAIYGYINGVNVASNSVTNAGPPCNLVLFVPNGSTYEVTISGGSVSEWIEIY